MMVGAGAHARPLEDCAGLCFPGRWHPRDRVLPVNSVAHALGQRLAEETKRFFGDGHLLAKAAAGKVEENPFPPDKTREIREWIRLQVIDPDPDQRPKDTV